MNSKLLLMIMLAMVSILPLQALPFVDSALFATLALRKMQLQQEKNTLEAQIEVIENEKDKFLNSLCSVCMNEAKLATSTDEDDVKMRERLHEVKGRLIQAIVELHQKEKKLKIALLNVEEELKKLSGGAASDGESASPLYD